MTLLRFDDGAARHDGAGHSVMEAAQRRRHFVTEGARC
jgi:hypothetical protein